ncbi:MAG: hypothetical protein WBA20_11195 [Ketobacter sp.]
MNIYTEVSALNQDEKNRKKIQRYLLSCCKKYEAFRSGRNFKYGLLSASKYIDGRISWKEFHKYEWELEGEAFGIEFYRSRIPYFLFHPDKSMLADLKKIRIQKGMSHIVAIEYLEALAYFIVYVLSYCYRAPGDLPPNEYSKFMCPILFKKYFNNVAKNA